MINILVCDDEPDIVSALKIYLEADGYTVFSAYNGDEAIAITQANDIHLILMDIMMPVTDGITAMLAIRKQKNTPVILLTAKSEDNDKVMGLNVGADDYITKPFNPVELLARVRSQIRRYTQLGATELKEESTLMQIGGITVDDGAKSVTVDGNPVFLTPTEYAILLLLMKNEGKVMSPDEIYERIHNEASFGAPSAVAVHIRHLREKIEINPSQPQYIKVVWAHGYKFERK